jgi:hypothetical protein
MHRRTTGTLSVLFIVLTALFTAACGTGAPKAKPRVADVATESTTPIAQALESYGYQPIVPLYVQKGRDKGKRSGAIFVVCAGKYKDKLSECALNYHRAVTDDRPGVVVVNGKVIKLIGGRVETWLSASNFVLDVPDRNVPDVTPPAASAASPAAAPATWRDIIRLTPEQRTQLLASLAAAKKLCCGDVAHAEVSVDGLGQVRAGWE